MSANREAITSESNETLRLEAFSDGVFAIAITLLVLELRLPVSSEEDALERQLLALWPAYLAYVTSFITIGILWANHHSLFRLIRRTDRMLTLLNILLLMIVTFLNFPTAIVAEHLEDADAQIAVLLYSGTLFMVVLLFNVIWWYVSRNHRMISRDLKPETVRTLTRQYVAGCLLYGVALILVFISTTLSVVTCLLLAVFFALPVRLRPLTSM